MRNRLHRDTKMDKHTIFDHEQPEDDDYEPDGSQLINAITNVLTILQRNTQKYNLLNTRVPIFKGQKEPYNEFEYLRLNHIRSFQKKYTVKEKLHFFTSFFREDAIHFWQTIRLTPEITLTGIL